MDLDLGEFIMRQIYMGTYEPEETELIQSLLSPGMRFLDIGANVGYFTALARGRVGVSGEVYAFEPSPLAFRSLQKMIHANGWSNVNAINAGLSSSPGKLDLYLGDPGNHTPTMVPHDQKSLCQVEVKTLDDVFSEHPHIRFDVMKMDVEGFEPNVVKGGRQFFRRGAVKTVLSEFNAHWLNLNGSSVDKLHSLFEELGFRLHATMGMNRVYKHHSA